MKYSTIQKQLLFTLTFTLVLINASIGQTNWLVGGNSFAGAASPKKIGSTNCYEVAIIADGKTMQTYTPSCLGGTSRIKTTATIVDFGGSTDVILPGSGTIKNDTTRAAIQLQATPTISGKSVVYAVSLATGKINCYGFQAKAVPLDGYGYGTFSEGGRYGTYSKANGGAITSTCYGLYGNSVGTAGARIGVRGLATTAGSADNYGVYGSASGGINNNAGYFSGNVTYTGNLISTSDMRLKENIKPFTGALTKINNLEVKTYNYKSEYDFMNLSKGNQIGLIAQNLEKVFPELVIETVHPADFDPETNEKISDEVRFKGVNYMGLIPVLVEAIKEQQVEIENLNTIKNENAEMKNEISSMRNELAEIKNMLYQMQSQKATGSEIQKPVLEQNAPNPFSEKTTISYFLPANTQNAAMNIYSIDNRLLKTYQLNSNDNNQITISSGTLSVGSYIYELVIDNKVVDSKKMVLTK